MGEKVIRVIPRYHTANNGTDSVNWVTIGDTLEFVQTAAINLLSKYRYNFACLVMETRGIKFDVILGNEETAKKYPDALDMCITVANSVVNAANGFDKNEIDYIKSRPFRYYGNNNEFMHVDTFLDSEKDMIICTTYIYGASENVFVGDGLSETMALWLDSIVRYKKKELAKKLHSENN